MHLLGIANRIIITGTVSIKYKDDKELFKNSFQKS
jgi:hypothetical protein